MVINESSIDITKKAWARMSQTQKKQILINTGHSPSFAKAKTMKELVNRGGGMAAKSFHTVVKTYKKRNPQYNKINWI